MKRIIATYFYQHEDTDLYEYGNINLDHANHENVYWDTIYVFYKTSINFNKDKYEHVFFTNKKNFKLRNTLLKLGVKVYDDVTITYKNKKKWAAVKYLFDVMRYIYINKAYSGSDAFVLLDTDVLFISDLKDLFEQVYHKNLVCYEFETIKGRDQIFHGRSIASLENTAKGLLGRTVLIKNFVGGEFLAFKYSKLKIFISYLDKLLNNKTNTVFTTEEQILTVMRAIGILSPVNNIISRVWTSMQLISIPGSFDDLAILHLPSEKETGLKMLAKKFKEVDKLNGMLITTKQEYIDLLNLNNPLKLRLRILFGFLRKKYFSLLR